jgi:hypothetical protein
VIYCYCFFHLPESHLQFLYNIHGTALLQCVFPNNHRLKAEKETRFDQHSSLLSFYSFDYPRWRVYKRMNVLRSRSIKKSLRHQVRLQASRVWTLASFYHLLWPHYRVYLSLYFLIIALSAILILLQFS